MRLCSYNSDGTEIERGMQRIWNSSAPRMLKLTYAHPLPGVAPVEIKITMYWSIPIVIWQDSLHGQKNLRSFLFSGARVPTLGDSGFLYRMLDEAVDEPDCPLYTKDVRNTDKQNDSAAIRVFSAAFLEFTNKNHPEWLGLLIFLFVFGDLIDEHQSRTMQNSMRIKIAWRTKFFLQACDAFLNRAGYHSQHVLARETREILDIIWQQHHQLDCSLS